MYQASDPMVEFAASRRGDCAWALTRCHARRAFSLMDVIVSIAVVTVLMALLMPTLGTMHETTRRINCASNLRQMGLATAMYTSDYADLLPDSIFLRPNSGGQIHMMTLRLSSDEASRGNNARGFASRAGASPQVAGQPWDGFGLVFGLEYVTAPRLFYCPSHYGNHHFQQYSDKFGHAGHADSGRVVSNYHYRGQGPGGERRLSRIRPITTALAADGLASRLDFNHKNGTNLLRADISVVWFMDLKGELIHVIDRVSSGSGTFGATPQTDPWRVVDGNEGSVSVR